VIDIYFLQATVIGTQKIITFSSLKIIVNQIWTYGVKISAFDGMYHVRKLQLFHSKNIRPLVSASWAVNKKTLCTDLGIISVKDEIARFAASFHRHLLRHSESITG
jgi:hypothetical protein